jgi:hypothetical protein
MHAQMPRSASACMHACMHGADLTMPSPHLAPSPHRLHACMQALMQHLLAGSDIASAVRKVAEEAEAVSLEDAARNPPTEVKPVSASLPMHPPPPNEAAAAAQAAATAAAAASAGAAAAAAAAAAAVQAQAQAVPQASTSSAGDVGMQAVQLLQQTLHARAQAAAAAAAAQAQQQQQQPPAPQYLQQQAPGTHQSLMLSPDGMAGMMDPQHAAAAAAAMLRSGGGVGGSSSGQVRSYLQTAMGLQVPQLPGSGGSAGYMNRLAKGQCQVCGSGEKAREEGTGGGAG